MVRIHRPLPGETATLYEVGIPVVETGDGYHLDIAQKVPLDLEREHVRESYLRTLRTLVLNVMHERLTPEDANAAWVRDAFGTSDVSPEAVRTVVSRRSGDKAVSYDPSDREANKLSVAGGRTVIHGGQFSAAEWRNVRAAGVLLPAGKVTPSPKPFGEDGDPLCVIPPEGWSAAERAMVALYERLAPLLVGHAIRVVIVANPTVFWAVCYAPGSPLRLNKGRLGARFFNAGASEQALDLLIHELGHEWERDHLSKAYYAALTKLGARLALAVAHDPDLLTVQALDGP